MAETDTGVTEASAEAAKDEDEGKAEAQDVVAPGPAIAVPGIRRTFRTLYWAAWFFVAPFVIACTVVWALTPASGVYHAGVLGWIEGVVREQPVPVGIVLFTIAEMSLWALRHRLPLAEHAHTPLRDGVPEGLRGPFERARTIVDDAPELLSKAGSKVSKSDIEDVQGAVDALKATMQAPTFEEGPFMEALSEADRLVDRRLSSFKKSEVREYVESIAIAILVAMGLRQWVVEAFKIPSGSMIPTLQVGDHIFVNKFTYGPAVPFTKARLFSRMPPDRGDVMVFAFPEHPEQDFIKRVIALPGDELRARGGHPILNGWEVPSCYVGVYAYNETEPGMRHEGDLFVEFLDDEAYLTLYDHLNSGAMEMQGPYYVKPGEVWVMGDNRNNSHDSRAWFSGQGGGVPFDNVKGRALFVWLSVSDSGMDWSRLGAPVMGRPRLPAAMKHLEPGIDKCIRERPALAKTTPPKPIPR